MRYLKIVVAIIFCFLISGCYDYQEVNNIDIITGLGIDFQEGEYIITLEVLNNVGDKTAIKLDTSLVTGNGISIPDALINAANKLNKTPNYSHLKVMVITKEVLKDKWFSVMDFFLRNTDFRENFYVVTTNTKAKDILNNKDENNKVVSVIISNYIENQKYNTITKTFEDYATDNVTFNKSLIFTNIDIENNSLVLNGSTIYNNNKIFAINKKETEIYNLFNKNKPKIILDNYYNNKVFSLVITNSNLTIAIKNNTITITGLINAKILNNETNINIRNLKNIDMLNNDFKKIVENNINNLMNKIKTYNTDIFGIDNMNYQINRKRINNYWLNQDVMINIEFNIDKKGLIYEVDYEK